MAAEGWDVVIPAIDEKNANDIAAMVDWLTVVKALDGRWVVIIPVINRAQADVAAAEMRDRYQLACDINEAPDTEGDSPK